MCNAYSEAKAILSTELSQDEYKRIWLDGNLSMSDFMKALNQSKSKYENKPASKARKWLAVFSGKVTYYNTVLDVLVQQYPEYVSLAWGAMKFLFIVSLRSWLFVNVAKFFRQSTTMKRRRNSLPRPSLGLQRSYPVLTWH
jgi:hypothetical protein